MEHWARYFKTQFEKEYSEEEESGEEVFLTAEPLVTEPSQQEMEKAVCSLKINKSPGGDDVIAEVIKNARQELKKRLRALTCKKWRDENMPDNLKGDKMKCEKLSRNNATKYHI